MLCYNTVESSCYKDVRCRVYLKWFDHLNTKAFSIYRMYRARFKQKRFPELNMLEDDKCLTTDKIDTSPSRVSTTYFCWQNGSSINHNFFITKYRSHIWDLLSHHPRSLAPPTWPRPRRWRLVTETGRFKTAKGNNTWLFWRKWALWQTMFPPCSLFPSWTIHLSALALSYDFNWITCGVEHISQKT